MGGNETKFIVSNASKKRVTVEIFSKKPEKKVTSSLVSIGEAKIKSTEKVQDNIKAVIEGGTEYEFVLEKSYIGGNVRFSVEDKEDKFLQHKVKKGMIISSSGDLVYSDNLDRPWISYSTNQGKTIDHKSTWTKWNDYNEEKDKLKHEYDKTQLGVSIERKKRYDEADQAYLKKKDVLKQKTQLSWQKLKDYHDIENDEDEDFYVTKKGDKYTSNDKTVSSSKIKGKITKGLMKMI